MLQLSFLMLELFVVVVLMSASGMDAILTLVLELNENLTLLPTSVLVVALINSSGIFKDNALLQGMDHLVEASSTQPSAFFNC